MLPLAVFTTLLTFES